MLIHLLLLMTPCVSFFIKALCSPHEQMLAIQIRHRLCLTYPSVTPCTSLNDLQSRSQKAASPESWIAVVVGGMYDFKRRSGCDFGLITDHFYQFQRSSAAVLPLFSASTCILYRHLLINLCYKQKTVDLDMMGDFAAV